ncbi:hypothetical protein Mycsm_06069 [Mycobacterium sp. JS623]|uniref:hypothetical protein n=1 Tax=Mycobacterium sp. JS623 TaxID=212767 RepID=UPI0002A56428|nr:hypothetical protein [Mycobacterium sp. JS623]AGB26230.1 hypothetical protein Mycsm_06069 [Mycobacterium sp. JS623]
MSRTVAVVWHASFSIAAGVLYFFFVLPRWWELSGDTSHTLGTALRIVTGALIGLAALPVVFTLLRTRRPEFGTPQMALRLRTSSIALHVFAGVLILGTAISEIWISLDSAGQWLFGIYGAAAAIALLGIFAFHLAFVAELPPPPPKPIKPKKAKQGRRRRRKAEDDEATEVEDEATEESTEDEAEDSSESDIEGTAGEKAAEVTAESTEAAEPESAAEEPESAAEDEPEADATNGGLRNRRRRRLRVRG